MSFWACGKVIEAMYVFAFIVCTPSLHIASLCICACVCACEKLVITCDHCRCPCFFGTDVLWHRHLVVPICRLSLALSNRPLWQLCLFVCGCGCERGRNERAKEKQRVSNTKWFCFSNNNNLSGFFLMFCPTVSVIDTFRPCDSKSS